MLHPRHLAPLVLAACGNVATEPPDAAPDASPDPRVTVTATYAGPLIAYREGDGAWQVPAATGLETHTFAVGGPYVVATACASGDGVSLIELGRTPDDPTALDLRCDFAPTGRVRGRSVEALRVSVGPGSVSTEPETDFVIDTLAGARDVVAVGDGRIVIRRGIDVDGETVLASPISVATEGTALVPIAASITGALADDTLSSRVFLHTATLSFGALYLGAPAGVVLAPSAILADDDRQRVTITATGSAGRRSMERELRVGQPASFALPGPLDASFVAAGQTFDAVWSASPTNGSVGITVDQTGDAAFYRLLELSLSSAYLAATGTTRAGVDTSVPGIEPAWFVDPGQPYVVRVYVADEPDPTTRLVAERSMTVAP
jgi:hypothetical protein